MSLHIAHKEAYKTLLMNFEILLDLNICSSANQELMTMLINDLREVLSAIDANDETRADIIATRIQELLKTINQDV